MYKLIYFTAKENNLEYWD